MEKRYAIEIINWAEEAKQTLTIRKEIILDDENITFLIETYTNEAGVRKIKEKIVEIIRDINLNRFHSDEFQIPFTIKKEYIQRLFENKPKVKVKKIHTEPAVGLVNGLWANDLGIGGLIPIECCWIPAAKKLELELTGMQGDVMKESMSVARSVAWRILPDDIKLKLNEKMKDMFDYGIHIHCPDGSTPKDGPSAGGAITTCLISLLTNTKASNQIAMTGEINLKGNITAIGGLEEKLFGAKKAGAKLVLCPKENSKDLDDITNKFTNLLDCNFQVKFVENIWDILNEVIQDKINWIRFD